MEMDMKKRWRQQCETLIQYLTKKLVATGEIPFVFQDKMLKTGLLSFFIVMIGTYMGVQFEESSFLIMTWILAVFSFSQIFRFLKIGKTGEYEMLEAQVLAIKGKHYPGRTCQAILQDKAGNNIRLWLPKERYFMVGKTYRFYFKKVDHVQGKTEKVKDCRYEIFYGMEEIQQEER